LFSLLVSVFITASVCAAQIKGQSTISYPAVWFAPINDPNKPDWEILPQGAKAGEIILSKRQ
jgi:hypothetical protein